MSTMRKALKVLSLLAVVGGIDLLITLIVLNTSGDQAPDLLHSIVMGFVILFAFLLGAQGISAANVPVRARALLPVALVGLLVNAAEGALAEADRLEILGNIFKGSCQIKPVRAPGGSFLPRAALLFRGGLACMRV